MVAIVKCVFRRLFPFPFTSQKSRINRRFILQWATCGEFFDALPLFELLLFTAMWQEMEMVRKMEIRGNIHGSLRQRTIPVPKISTFLTPLFLITDYRLRRLANSFNYEVSVKFHMLLHEPFGI